jgi:hypothetical protein
MFIINWLGGRDSNPDSQIQSLKKYFCSVSLSFLKYVPVKFIDNVMMPYAAEFRLVLMSWHTLGTQIMT